MNHDGNVLLGSKRSLENTFTNATQPMSNKLVALCKGVNLRLIKSLASLRRGDKISGSQVI